MTRPNPASGAPPSDPAPPPAGRRALWAAAVAAGLWAVGLGTLAATEANPPTLNRVQFARADAVLHAVLLEPVAGDAARVQIIEAVPGGRGPAAEMPAGELAKDAELTVSGFPAGVVKPGRRAGVAVRRVAGGWAVAAGPDGLPPLVHPLNGLDDWSGLKAAAAALSEGEPAYR